MAITRAKKEEVIKEGVEAVKASKALVFADFSGTSVSDMRALRKELIEVDSKMTVIKKSLLDLILKEAGVKLDPARFEGQVGTFFVGDELSAPTGLIYRFSKNHEDFKLLGGYDIERDMAINEDAIVVIGQLPTREVLLAQVVGSIAAPIRGLLYVLSQKAEMTN
ncbi:MAG: 50S ribosomal protein L10 [Candidatus Colwellbacteria bacterium CG10_big_fil_rev_8_21_14_0_10_41_28]|uniref:Large ribosomal subunit protein uL10 n=1 Tax=Candidatus Colwellbacteria bacterium CG10_big_fil_rev_8_21_14_0_10_41_28 TaxID=1974539 RepID=A0A2H0VHG0_9BACT|nr:MAG: 50S ribosomal protein L10 [Candidatus Colwellbacteria bacterium CG10_big_fil_rev_8_21_14_0_10_41_28]